MMHVKTDSNVTSTDMSSSPKRAVYYVQSPSRDSHDGDKVSSNNNNSPMDSPSHHSYGHHSRTSSASRVSGSFLNDKGNPKRHVKGWPECKVIEEEEGYNDQREGLSRRTQIFVGVVGFVLIFTVFCLIIAGAARPYKVKISVKVE